MSQRVYVTTSANDWSVGVRVAVPAKDGGLYFGWALPTKDGEHTVIFVPSVRVEDVQTALTPRSEPWSARD